MSYLFQLDTLMELKVLAELWKKFPLLKPGENESQMVLLKRDKEQIANTLGVKLNTVDRIICDLTKKKLIYRVDRSRYALNAKYFFKGGIDERLKVMNFQIRYEIEEPIANSL